MERIFKIDFFELAFLAEACIPPVPIARSMFWNRLIDEYHEQMSEDERARLFEWIQRNPRFNMNNPDCYVFAKRFDPDNQYAIHAYKDKKRALYNCFKVGDRFYIKTNTSIKPEYITKFVKIQYKKLNEI
jgi:hypothetical protein